MSKDYKNVNLSAKQRAILLLEEMSLDEKMAQINCIFPFDKTYLDYEGISEQTPNGIGEISTLEMRRIETLEDAADWTRRVQKIVMDNSPHKIPAIFHMEGLCGAFIQEATSFPAGIGRGSSFNPALEEEIGQCVARQELACGITHILAPVLDISRDSRMGRQGETYGEDPCLAAAMGSAYVKGLQKTEVDGRRADSVAKHFLAFHNSEGGIHGTHSDTTERTLREVYAKPFQAAISESGLRGVMPCYCSIDNEPVSVSKKILKGLLRDEMGFDGLCVSDYGGIGNSHSVQHIGETYADVGEMALEATMDIEMPSTAGYCQELKARFESGKADISILDAAVLRVLEAKFRMGLFENPFALSGDKLSEEYAKADKEGRLTYESARESVVLLKNNGILPIDVSMDKKILLVGPHGANARFFFGGYTHMTMMESIYAVANSIAGVAGIDNTLGEEIKTVPGTSIQLDEGIKYDNILKCQKPECLSLLEYMEKKLPGCSIDYARGYHIAGNDNSLFDEALKKAKSADIVILTLGGKYGTCSLASMGEGVDSTDINLPVCQDEFIKEISGLGKPLIGIHFGGRPISSDVADEKLDAIIEAWAPAEAGAKVLTEIILGEYNPSGKLPVSVAYNAGQIPIYYNHPWGSANHQGESIGFKNYLETPHAPRYAFGHGVSYSDFGYSNLVFSKNHIRSDEGIHVQFDIENVSDITGTEIVQLYISDEFASRTRPVMEMAGFCRVELEAGEKKQVKFTLDPSQFAFLDENMKWKIEKGDIIVMIGSASDDIRLKSRFTIVDNAWIEGRDRSFYAKVEIE